MKAIRNIVILIVGLSVMLVSTCSSDAQSTDHPALFLVSIPSVATNESYVLPLSKQQDIEYARFLITRRNEPPPYDGVRFHAMAHIAKGADGINRNLLTRGAPQWSWHVTEFESFQEGISADFSWRISKVEANVDEWIAEHHGLIGFSTIAAELTNYVWLTVGSFHNDLVFDWRDFGTNYVYTLEQAPATPPFNWNPVPGITWPIASPTFSLRKGGPTNFFFRIKGERVN